MQNYADLVQELRGGGVEDALEVAFLRVLGVYLRTKPPLWDGFVLPENVPANEFLNLRGLKFSTSRGVAVWLHEFLEKYPADYLRYATAKIIPESKDTDFSWEGLQAAVNNELADTLGNFVNRSMTFAHKL